MNDDSQIEEESENIDSLAIFIAAFANDEDFFASRVSSVFQEQQRPESLVSVSEVGNSLRLSKLPHLE